MSTDDLQHAKRLARDLNAATDAAPDAELAAILAEHTTVDYRWRGMRPFYEQQGAIDVASVFWLPLRQSFAALQRREDIFFAGRNVIDDGDSTWAVSMGNLMGLFDADWLGIPATRKMAFLPYAEFHRVEDDGIAESAMFCDVLSIMHQAGCYPLPAPPTGATIVQPGPRTRDGVLLDSQPSDEGERTMAVVSEMIGDLKALNESGNDLCPPELLQKTWHDDMTCCFRCRKGKTHPLYGELISSIIERTMAFLSNDKYSVSKLHLYLLLRRTLFAGNKTRLSESWMGCKLRFDDDIIIY